MSPRRKAAIAGEATFTGQVCVRDKKHGGIRYTLNGACVQCVRDRAERQREELRALRAKAGRNGR